MFEKNALAASKTIYALIIGVCAAWLAWGCFANLPFWPALFLLPFALALAALAGAPLAAAASLVGGLLVAAIAATRKAITRLRFGA